MTTIATDGKSMAGDGRSCVMEKITSDREVKVRRLRSGAIFGYAGTVPDGIALGDWLDKGGEGPSPAVDKDMQGLLLEPDGLIRYYSGGKPEGRNDAPAAIGSGTDLAVAAMLRGASPAEAVATAALRDPFTGGEITEEVL